MTIESTLARVSSIKQTMSNPATLIGPSGGSEAPPGASGAPSSFADVLQTQQGTYGSASPATQTATAAEFDPSQMTATANGLASPALGIGGYPMAGVNGLAPASPSGGGSEMVAIAESQLGQAEQPTGSNESPAIAQYRSATAGAEPGAPWCAYFASWAAQQAGEPIGPAGQGLGSVSEIWSWAQSTGRAIPNGPGVVPKPGDLIVFGDQHVGIVRNVLPNGQIQTIEGNYENKVAANTRSPSEATGYVSMS
jgi:CHAP domain